MSTKNAHDANEAVYANAFKNASRVAYTSTVSRPRLRHADIRSASARELLHDANTTAERLHDEVGLHSLNSYRAGTLRQFVVALVQERDRLNRTVSDLADRLSDFSGNRD